MIAGISARMPVFHTSAFAHLLTAQHQSITWQYDGFILVDSPHSSRTFYSLAHLQSTKSTYMADPLHVIIVGAGLAGPALAIALAKNAIKSTILERRPYSQDIGGVIILAPNAMRVMDELLEIGDRLRAAGDEFKAINIYTKGSGPARLDKVGGFLVEDDGVLGLTIARPVLHQELLRKCEEMPDRITIRYSSELETIEESSDGCEAVLKGGSTVKGKLSCFYHSKYHLHLTDMQDQSLWAPTVYGRKSGYICLAKTTLLPFTAGIRVSDV